METKVNYTLVGAFVVLLTAGFIGSVLWLVSGKAYHTRFDTYVAYFDESVAGLGRNAPVRYRGVDIGHVRQIALDADRPQQVRVVLEIEPAVPLYSDTVATLRSQGLTGLVHVELSGGTPGKARRLVPGTPPPVLVTGPSLLVRLDGAVSQLIATLNRTADGVNTLLEPDNRKALKQLLTDLAAVSATLSAQRPRIERGLQQAVLTTEQTAAASAELPRLLERIGRSADAVDQLAIDLRSTSRQTRDLFGQAARDASRFSGETLPELARLTQEMRDLTQSLRRTAEAVEQQPSLLLQGQTPPTGPGE